MSEKTQKGNHYVLVVRSLYGGDTQLINGQIHIQNANEFVAYLNDSYLSQGYTILSVNYLGEVPLVESDPNSVKSSRFAYHLVKAY